MQDKQTSWPDGLKKTKQRICVFSVLEEAEKPMSAQQIYNQIQASNESVWLSTVYRVLEHFVNEGFVIKTTVMDNSIALYALNRNNHKHYAICVNCHKVIELENCPMDRFEPEFSESNFHVLGHKVEMYGYCKDCDEKISKIN